MTHKYIKTKNTIVSILLAAVVVTSASCGCQKKPDSVATPTPNPTEVAIVTEAPTTEPENTESSDATILPDSGTSAPGTEATAEATAVPTGEAADSTELPASDDPVVEATATAAPTATPKPTATPTPKPTAKPTATPTPKPTTSSEYPWSNEVTTYLTGDPDRFGNIRNVTTADTYYPTLADTVFGNCASGNGGGVAFESQDCHYETIGSNGIISQVYQNKWANKDIYEWVNEKRVAGVYLDASYEKPGVEPNTEIPFELQQFQELVTYNVFGVAVTVEQNKTNDMAVNFYPLSSGDFVLDLGSVPVILNEIPETVLVRGGPTTSGLRNLQISVDGHVVYEAEWLGNYCRF